MVAFYLISIILGVAGQSILKKPYTDKTSGKGVFFFSMLTSFVAMLFFFFSSGDKEWNMGIVPYSFAFAAAFAMANVFSIAAIGCGSVSLTSLISSYSLMVPAAYGILFLNDPIGKGLIPGLVLLCISLFLINKKGDSAIINFKWVVCVILSFIGNGFCSVFQKMQQVEFDGAYKNEFMIIALLMVVVVMGFFSFVTERKEMKTYVKSGWHLAIICGVLNGVVNLFVMILSGIMPVSIMFPTVSAGGIIVTYVVSKRLYKEELTKAQFWGFVTGIISVILLNI